jgi:hypothetical protein
MKIYILPIIFSADQENKNTFLLTQKGHNFLTPLVEIENIKFFQKEILQHVVNFFEFDEIKINSECKYNYLSIQEELSVKYVMKNFDFVKEDDLIVTYGGILLKYNCLELYQWTPMLKKAQNNGFSPDINLNFLLNNVIQRSIV